MDTPSRRSITRGIAWSVPVVTMAATAPAFAVSTTCKPYAECKKQGSGQNRKTYIINASCGPDNSKIESVTVDDRPTEPLGDGRFETGSFGDSRNFRKVVITFTDGTEQTSNVGFPPC